jgi:hypothetical protein
MLASNAGGRLLQRVLQQLLFGQLALRAVAQPMGTPCLQRKAVNIMIAKYFCDANAEILHTKYDGKNSVVDDGL